MVGKDADFQLRLDKPLLNRVGNLDHVFLLRLHGARSGEIPDAPPRCSRPDSAVIRTDKTALGAPIRPSLVVIMNELVVVAAPVPVVVLMVPRRLIKLVLGEVDEIATEIGVILQR